MDTFEELFENMTLAEKILAGDYVYTRLLTIFLTLTSEVGDDVTVQQLRDPARQMVRPRADFYERLYLL